MNMLQVFELGCLSSPKEALGHPKSNEHFNNSHLTRLKGSQYSPNRWTQHLDWLNLEHYLKL